MVWLHIIQCVQEKDTKISKFQTVDTDSEVHNGFVASVASVEEREGNKNEILRIPFSLLNRSGIGI
jgi:hypothetical protein